MKTYITLTDNGVVINEGQRERTMKDVDFYSRRSKAFKHVDVTQVEKMVETAQFTIVNHDKRMVTLQAKDSNDNGKSKLTQLDTGQSRDFLFDSFS